MTTYTRILDNKTMYEFAISFNEAEQTRRVIFINIYEEGQTRPFRIAFDNVPKHVIDRLITEIYDS